ncbi:hypothetical protein [Clostridium sp. YIM B02551]|uniref:hypothetical protein n=1 Tax=Clostridium sp. YIM B02551 TaxID=2910679 RepID=UPI001EEB0FB2|nr:hypothetical protein [Clostridium sp. YIM B02551]
MPERTRNKSAKSVKNLADCKNKRSLLLMQSFPINKLKTKQSNIVEYFRQIEA